MAPPKSMVSHVAKEVEFVTLPADVWRTKNPSLAYVAASVATPQDNKPFLFNLTVPPAITDHTAIATIA